MQEYEKDQEKKDDAAGLGGLDLQLPDTKGILSGLLKKEHEFLMEEEDQKKGAAAKVQKQRGGVICCCGAEGCRIGPMVETRT